MKIIDRKLENISKHIEADRYVYYRRVGPWLCGRHVACEDQECDENEYLCAFNFMTCDSCGALGVKYETFHWVENGCGYVSGHNADSEFYCSKKCMYKKETWPLDEEDDVTIAFIQVKNRIEGLTLQRLIKYNLPI